MAELKSIERSEYNDPANPENWKLGFLLSEESMAVVSNQLHNVWTKFSDSFKNRELPTPTFPMNAEYLNLYYKSKHPLLLVQKKPNGDLNFKTDDEIKGTRNALVAVYANYKPYDITNKKKAGVTMKIESLDIIDFLKTDLIVGVSSHRSGLDSIFAVPDTNVLDDTPKRKAIPTVLKPNVNGLFKG